MRKHVVISAAGLIALGFAISGCVVDPYKGMPYSYTTRGPEVLNKQKVDWQDQVVQPRCKEVAEQTVPSQTRLGGAYAINHGVAGAGGGAIGNTAGTAAEFQILGETAAHGAYPAIAAAGAINGGVQGAFNGYASGAEQSNAQRHGTVQSCLTNDAIGIHQVPPKLAHKIENGAAKPQSFAAPWETGHGSSVVQQIQQ